MKILNLTGESTVYTSNVYLVLGDWNTLDDVNTLVDVGRDYSIIEKIRNTSTGVGKKRVDQVVLTHSHYDHTGILSDIRREFQPRVLAWSHAVPGPKTILRPGQSIRMGDCWFEVIHVPTHSSDSVCLLCHDEGVLFTGDTPIRVLSQELIFDDVYVQFLERIDRINIKAIYPGHGQPILGECREVIRASLNNIKKGQANKRKL